jgi:hypothetical protein
MIFYYAIGGGLGHVTRAQRVLAALGLTDSATILASAASASDISRIEIPHALERHPAAHREWLRDSIQRDDRLIVDTFPGGIQGELCGLDLRMDFVARLLRWDEYRRVVSDVLPHFETTWIVEDLVEEELTFVRVNSERVERLCLAASDVGQTLLSVRTGTSVDSARTDKSVCPTAAYWLVVHSGPAEEVAELVAYAATLRDLASDKPSRVLVASRCDVDLPTGFEVIDAYPASPLFADAARIVSAAGFNVMLETEPWRDKHVVVPFPRRFDDQFARAARRRSTLTAS